MHKLRLWELKPFQQHSYFQEGEERSIEEHGKTSLHISVLGCANPVLFPSFQGKVKPYLPLQEVGPNRKGSPSSIILKPWEAAKVALVLTGWLLF